MRVAVLGASGMAGHVVTLYLQEQGFDVTPLAGHTKVNDQTVLLDLTNKEAFEAFLDTHEFDAIVNCVGILIQQSEDRKDLASYLNGFLPHYLEQRYKDSKTKIIHLSTDCVFSGKSGPYKEDATYDGESFYDRSKALGEVINDKDLTFRMSIVGPDLSPKGVGLFNWHQAQTSGIFGYTNAVWNGITTIELAKAICAALKEDLTGLYHLVPDEGTTKFGILTLFSEVFNRDDVPVRPKEVADGTDKSLINTRTDFSFHVQDYPAMVAEMKQWVDDHKDLYPHYQR